VSEGAGFDRRDRRDRHRVVFVLVSGVRVVTVAVTIATIGLG
jgi:hypothetical protein